MSDYIPTKNNFISVFEILPSEILLHIFDYLTSNEIICAFIGCNQRLQHLLLTQKYHFKIPTTNLPFWNNILPMLGLRIQTLIIDTDHLTVSLDFFSNLTSMIIPSPFNLLDGQLKSILHHPCFSRLHTLKIKDDIIFKKSFDTNICDDEQILFKTIFNNNNCVQIFEYLPLLGRLYYRNLPQLNSNNHLRYLRLNLLHFEDIFTLLQHTPNLIYLNVQSKPPERMRRENSWKMNNEIKLEELHLKLQSREILYNLNDFSIVVLDQLFGFIHLFSSSLITLSLNFTDIYVVYSNSVLCNGIKLENQLLKSMQKLQNFYFSVGFRGCKDVQQILSTFATFPWPIGLHGNAHIYSLPFSFDELKDFHHFQDVRSNNDEFLKQNDRLWSKVTSLNLVSIDRIDFKHLFPLIKQNMPKLSSIVFYGGVCFNQFSFPDESGDSYDEIERINNVQLDSVTTVRFDHMSMEQIKQIPMYSFPNLQCLILNHTKLPSNENELMSFLGQKLQRIEFDEYSTQNFFLVEQNLCYLSNIKHMKLTFGFVYCGNGLNSQPEITRNLLRKLPKLEALLIHVPPNAAYDEYGSGRIYDPIIDRLDENEIKAQYKIEYSGAYMWIIKKTIPSSSSFEHQILF